MKNKFLVLLLLSVFVFAALSTVSAQDSETFVMGIEDEISNLDPGETTISVNERTVSLIFDGLVEYGENNKIVPGIAEDWTISDDGLVYTFELFPKIYFY